MYQKEHVLSSITLSDLSALIKVDEE